MGSAPPLSPATREASRRAGTAKFPLRIVRPMDELEVLEAEVRSCPRCRLCETR